VKTLDLQTQNYDSLRFHTIGARGEILMLPNEGNRSAVRSQILQQQLVGPRCARGNDFIFWKRLSQRNMGRPLSRPCFDIVRRGECLVLVKPFFVGLILRRAEKLFGSQRGYLGNSQYLPASY